MIMLMQGNVKRVLAQQSGDWTQICLEWSDGRAASLTCTGKDGAFWANIDLEQENRTFQITSDNFGAFIENLVAFLEGEEHSCDTFGDSQDYGSPGSLSESLPTAGILD